MKNQNPIKNYMTLIPFHVDTDTLAIEAAELMRDKSISHLPVFSNYKLVGIVSSRDLQAAISRTEDDKITVENFMTHSPYSVLPDHPIHDVMRTMAKRKIGSTIVQEVEGSVVGIFTTYDALLAFSTLIDELSEDFLQKNLWNPLSIKVSDVRRKIEENF